MRGSETGIGEPSRSQGRQGHRGRAGGRRGAWCRALTVLALAFVAAACSSTPTYRGLEATPLFERGTAYYEAEEWDRALDVFEHFLVTFPNDSRTAEARFMLARAHFEKREFITSAAEFERFMQRYPNHGRVAEASIGICRSYERLSPTSQRDQTYTQRAVDACRETINEFPGLNVAEEARDIQRRMIERLAQREYEEGFWYERRRLHDQAIVVYQDLVDFYPQTSWAPRGYLGLYRSYRAIGWDTEAEQARARLLANYPDSPEARELRDGEGDRGNGAGR
jgi:outer membrane protein assembly factor BamD